MEISGNFVLGNTPMIKHYNIPIFIPELACPFQCAFCNQKKISGHINVPDENEIIKTIEDHLSSFKQKNRTVDVAYFGGSFTGIPYNEQEHYLSIVQPYIKKGLIQSIRLSTRPDYINEEILNLLKKYNVGTIELGAQSLDDEVLKKTFRGHTVKQVEDASALILKFGFNLGLQMMIGLPGDSLKKSMATAKKIVELGANNTRIYPALVIKDTAMHTWYKQGKYSPLDLEEAVNWTKKILPVFESAGVDVIRVGLHPSEGLLNGSDLIDGPFHISFKELVLTEIWNDKLKPFLEIKTGNSIIVNVPFGSLNHAIGHKAKNKKMLLKRFKSLMFCETEHFNVFVK
jgi:histone acetyltransferase (RNA polymerase elongator complex component)